MAVLNRYTLEDISNKLNTSIDDCVQAYEREYDEVMPPSLLVVGNLKQRQKLREYIKNGVAVLLCGPNGTGKYASVKYIAKALNLTIRKSIPLKQSDIVVSFGKGPLYNNNSFLYVIDVNSLNKRSYSVLSKYAQNSLRPLILIADSKDKVNSRLLSKLEVVSFFPPSQQEIEYFLTKKYKWKGEINDIYDPDINVVIFNVLGDTKFEKPEKIEEVNSKVMAFNISSGYTAEFDKLSEPFWWVLRWTAYNQQVKHPNNITNQIENLKKLSEIDQYKFLYNPTYLFEMSKNIIPSNRRCYFQFPPWAKKTVVKEEAKYEKVKVTKKKKTLDKVDFSKWL